MGEYHLRLVISKIESELASLARIHEGMTGFQASNDGEPRNDLDVRLYGSFLHDFFTCVERIFREIAASIDGEVPTGETWHRSLLDQMALDITGVRTKVIDTSLKARLYEYLRFRHIFRNVYGFDLKWDKISTLVKDYSSVYSEVEASIRAFVDFLRKIDPSS